MKAPLEVVASSGEALMRGDYATMVRRYALPMAVEHRGVHHVITTEIQVIEALTAIRADLLRCGIASAETRVLSAWEGSGNAYLTAEITYLSASRRRIDTSRMSYVLRRDDIGEWRILVLAIDKACNYTPGACTLERAAA